MDTPLAWELVGYIASVLVAVSLMMSKIVRLRIVNLMGAATFAIYGLLIGSIPVAAVNAFIVLVNLWYLWGILRAREFFRILPVRSDSDYLAAFIEFYRAEIALHQPDFAPDDVGSFRANVDLLCLFVLRDLVPAGLLVGEVSDTGELTVRLDFVIPSYRDFRVGRFLFEERADHLRAWGVDRIISPPGSPKHNRYLKRMGFVEEGDRFVFELP